MVDQPKLRQPSQLRLVDDVYHSLSSAILSGHIRPGERLIEARIAEELGVSRTTVRESLLKLERQGLVVNNPRRGTFVTRLSQSDALDLGYTRALLESFALTIGHTRINDQLIAQLETHLDEMGACALPEDVPRLVKIDLNFHRLLVETAGSGRIIELWSSLNGQIGALFIRGVEQQHANIDDVVALHRRLLDAIASPDPTFVQRAVLEHYVRLPGESADHKQAVLQTIQTIAASYMPGKQTAAGDDHDGVIRSVRDTAIGER